MAEFVPRCTRCTAGDAGGVGIPLDTRSRLRAGGRLLLAAAAGIAAAGAVVLVTLIPGYAKSSRGIVALHVFSKLLLICCGIRPVSTGGPRSGSSLVVANRVSWLDLLVLSAAGPMLPVAAPEVATWAVIGPMLSRIGAVFLRGQRCRELPVSVQQMTSALRRGHRVQVFAESVSAVAERRPSCELNPLRHAAFQAAVDAAVVISPVAIRYLDGLGRPVCASVLQAPTPIGSLWRILRSGPITIEVRWLPVIPAIADHRHRADHRRVAAVRTERAIARALGLGLGLREQQIAGGRSHPVALSAA
jgi:1-acyl-sn-glycerol-3-phosphate acyltransferase